MKLVDRDSDGGSAPITKYTSYTAARANFKQLLDTAASGRVVELSRGHEALAVVRSRELRKLLEGGITVRPEMLFEDGAWVILIPGAPIAAEAEDLDAAVEELVEVIREYAADWHLRLRFAPNHEEFWRFVQFVDLSDDAQLREWITGSQG